MKNSPLSHPAAAAKNAWMSRTSRPMALQLASHVGTRYRGGTSALFSHVKWRGCLNPCVCIFSVLVSVYHCLFVGWVTRPCVVGIKTDFLTEKNRKAKIYAHIYIYIHYHYIYFCFSILFWCSGNIALSLIGYSKIKLKEKGNLNKNNENPNICAQS